MFKFKSSSNQSSAASTHSVTTELGPVTHEPILTPPKDYQPILNDPLNEEQKTKIKDLLAYMETIMLAKDDPYYASERGFLTEATAHRYMRARKWDFEEAKNMLEKTVKWRREFKPDQLDPEYIRPETETGKMYFSGFDKFGRPLLIMKPRNENSKDSDRQVKHIVFCLERAMRLMPENVEKITIVTDFRGLSMSNNPSINTSKRFLEILGNHYPERLGAAFLKNSPWFFLASFKVIAPFVDPVTRNKIKFINSGDSKDATNDVVNMEDYIPLDNMEVDLGGKYNFEYEVNAYWQKLFEYTGNPFKVIEYK
ncbi:CRAL-TRIO domain-containing protein [Choanephora cucurbitarum]|nr:CRAL-TRIO domain-containing protein [Choanephora cucurbitarum]